MAKKEKAAKPRRVIIRLYRQFDLDLIYFFESIKSADVIQDTVKSILRTYISGKSFKGDPVAEIRNPDECPVLRRKIQMHILMDLKNDADILEWLETITLGYRNTVIKGIIRNYIGSPLVYPCLVTTDLVFKGKDAVIEGDEDKNE
ncbi:MAG: hypothetical protein II399_10165 [Lachnospiraceae bacterium]|nr:hypothetical protein [Lachnospiraceae bacterium]